MFGQGQTLSAHSFEAHHELFCVPAIGHFTAAHCKGPAEVKGRERLGDADALWPQPVVQLENPYFLQAINHFPGQLLGGKGRDIRILPGKFSLPCTMPPCSFMESEKLRFELYSCLGRLYSFLFSIISRVTKSGQEEFGQCCVPSLPHTPVPCV